ncbi:MAG: hypothetical protein ACJAUD_002379 [Crocinitomicaceae bacterium]|jgi:hypothetical protein
MGGNDGIRGYIVQTIIAVLDSLEDSKEWQTITIEPNLSKDFEKVDILFTFEDEAALASQVKSTRSIFSYADANRWCEEISTTVPEGYRKELVLVGRVAQKLFDVTELHDVSIPEPKALNIQSLLDEGSTKIDRFYTKNNRPTLNVNLRELLLKALVTQFSQNSITGIELKKEDFEAELLTWITSIESHILKEPLFVFSEIGNKSEKVSFGHHITSKILDLIGWTQFGENEIITWFDEETGEEQIVQLDFIGDFDNELKSNSHIYLNIRTFNSPEYPQNPKEFIKSIYRDSDQVWKLLTTSNKLNIIPDKEIDNYDLTFWYSNGLNDIDRYYVTELFESEYGNNYMHSKNNYFFIDNAKTNFLISAIITARLYRDSLQVKFLYPITQDNMTEEKIGKRGSKLPIQYVTSSVIPIIKEDAEKISFLLFCSDNYSTDALRKLIWLTINLTSGLGNEYIIYFPDYDNQYDNESRATIRSFRDEALSAKTSVKKITNVNNEDLATLPSISQNLEQLTADETSSLRVDIKPVGTLFTDYLPYGDLLRPFLGTDQIQGKDLKIFLARRGVFFKNASKKKLIDFMSGLLFSPSELDSFRAMINVKEKPQKQSPMLIN